ncbi:hypothetical protein FRC06_008062 [Ceratobasidium sp. 370]|nr:hypothetical protein FRC06_008062 [Ceratobasidium sp. 370]
MFSKSLVSLALLAVLSSSAQARMRIIERDGRALWGRRFGQENPAVVADISRACDGAVCGVLGGKAIGTLLAASPECAQQDLADDIIDAARKQDAATGAKMIELAKIFRQAEKNTPPDFTTNPPTNRNSVFCQTPPRNPELVGLNQAQDPANDPNIFFDPACKCSVKKGSQANTSPLGGNATSGGGAANNAVTSATPAATATSTDAAAATETETAAAVTTDAAATTTDATATATEVPATCPAVATVTVTVDAAATATATATDVATSTDAAATEAATETAAATTATETETATATGSAAPPAATGALPAGVDLGSCTDPTIRFGAGIENRKETSFIPNNTKEFPHGSAQNSAIITQFICDTFVNSCKANAAAVALCADAKAAAAAAGAKKGAAADAFNGKFGVTTNFASVQALDDQGNPVA